MDYQEIRKRKDKGPYDTTLEYKINMYDNMPYIRDINICNIDLLTQNNSNIIKFYRCKVIETILIQTDTINE